MMAKRKQRKQATADPEVVTDPRALLDSLVAESQLQQDVIETAQRYGYLVNHNYDSRRSGPDDGLPDLVLARETWKVGQRGRLLFVELKRSNGRVSGKQKRWLSALRLAGVEAYVWRPADWRSGYIEQVLQGDVIEQAWARILA